MKKTAIEWLVLSTIVLIVAAVICVPVLQGIAGVGWFGPARTLEVQVDRLYVDYSDDGETRSSHYMVGTDQGVFEVANSLLLWVFNADELYSTLQEGKRYEITTRGNKFVNLFYQKYPYITGIRTISENIDEK